jgi:hypothetical protein
MTTQRTRRPPITPEEKARREEEARIANTAALEAASIPFKASDNGLCLVIRQKGKPKIDFYPANGRWNRYAPKIFMTGGVEKFLAWYATQTQAGDEENNGRRPEGLDRSSSAKTT